MKRLYVVYGWDDRPFAECERFRDAYRQARECLGNGSEYITIDIYIRDWARWYTYECSYGDFYFIDRKGNAILPEDLSEMWVLWLNLFDLNKDNIDLLKDVAKTFEFELNDIGEWVYKDLYSIQRKDVYKK